MREKRRHTRLDLDGLLILALDMEERPRAHCLVRNLSLGGALLECPSAGYPEDVEPGDAVHLDDEAPETQRLVGGVRGVVVWTYRRFIGVEFRDLLFSEEEILRRWLEDHHLLLPRI
ncbi:PilZ domain-containing protein [Desulfovibrio aminophilus]|nr:PilZ domain-containing protein [Desulfovibrio aminophilus]MCM0753647.1 PilZ domain-containing protein [Desulfovibrio aminophilus]